jgi:hypothetical protein
LEYNFDQILIELDALPIPTSLNLLIARCWGGKRPDAKWNFELAVNKRPFESRGRTVVEPPTQQVLQNA